MSDGQVLFLILCLIYATDCFAWLNSHSVAFCAWWGRDWKAKTAHPYWGPSAGGPLLLNPIPPLGRVICAQVVPVSLSPDGIAAYNSQSFGAGGRPHQTGAVALFEQVHAVVSRGNELVINNEVFCKCRTRLQAEMLVGLIDSLRMAAPENRRLLIEDFWEKQFNLEKAQKEYSEAARQILFLKCLCNALFVYLFILVPSLTLALSLDQLLIPAAVIMLLLAAQISLVYYFVHRTNFPFLKTDRIGNVVKMIVCPPVAIRACDLLTTYLLAQYSPFTLASLFLSSDRRQHFCGNVLRDLIHPISGNLTDPRPALISAWQNSTIVNMASRHLPDVALCLERIRHEPQREAPDCGSYCPRCLGQFHQQDGYCPDCTGVTLIPFSDATTSKQPQ